MSFPLLLIPVQPPVKHFTKPFKLTLMYLKYTGIHPDKNITTIYARIKKYTTLRMSLK